MQAGSRDRASLQPPGRGRLQRAGGAGGYCRQAFTFSRTALSFRHTLQKSFSSRGRQTASSVSPSLLFSFCKMSAGSFHGGEVMRPGGGRQLLTLSSFFLKETAGAWQQGACSKCLMCQCVQEEIARRGAGVQMPSSFSLLQSSRHDAEDVEHA